MKPTLYHCNDARSLRCLWTAEEIGLEINLVCLPFPPRAFAPAYKQINPLGTIPCWIDRDVTLTESAAICQIMARGSRLEVMADEAAYPEYLNWLHRSDATLTFPLAIMLRYSVFPPKEARKLDVAEDYKAFFLGRARAIETALSDGRTWIVADRFTIADICIGYALFLATTLHIDGELGELSRAYLDRLMQRTAFKTARTRQKNTLQTTSPYLPIAGD